MVSSGAAEEDDVMTDPNVRWVLAFVMLYHELGARVDIRDPATGVVVFPKMH